MSNLKLGGYNRYSNRVLAFRFRKLFLIKTLKNRINNLYFKRLMNNEVLDDGLIDNEIQRVKNRLDVALFCYSMSFEREAPFDYAMKKIGFDVFYLTFWANYSH